ncbi:hypothetical protein JTB14_007078 [Gonioctena quinquepunctata]|nr:hypothetical protein JTB14_007078 [Gonioctena quinquepunctata]
MIFLLCSVFLISSALGAGELSILHHPPSLAFKGHDTLRASTLKEVYPAALGFTTEQFSNWRGLYLNDPFNVAQAIVTIDVDGVADIGQQKGHHYPLLTDTDGEQIFNSLKRRIEEHYPDQKTNLVNIDLSDGLEDVQKYSVFKGIPSENPKHEHHKYLSLQVEEDRSFLKEITLLHEIAGQIEEGAVLQDSIPDVFWFKVSAIHPLSDLHGENSSQALEAKQLLNAVIIRLNAAFDKTYNGNALITVITSDASHTRRSRSILEEAVPEDPVTPKQQYNLASYYDGNYPVMFNIILWLGIILLFSLIAICMFIGNMDPGRDSIIYRMTSTRMKKEN